jgi:hypothetical protein
MALTERLDARRRKIVHDAFISESGNG